MSNRLNNNGILRSHPGQLKSQERKKRNRAIKILDDAFEAAEKGISIHELHRQRTEELQQAILASDRRQKEESERWSRMNRFFNEGRRMFYGR